MDVLVKFQICMIDIKQYLFRTNRAGYVVLYEMICHIMGTRRYLEEMVRYGGCELHVTSSVLGGIAAQEAFHFL